MLKFKLPAGVGKDNELRIWRDEQPSFNDDAPVLIDFKSPLLDIGTPTAKIGGSLTSVKVDGGGMKIVLKGKHFGVVSNENLNLERPGLVAKKVGNVASLTFGGIDLISNPFNVKWSCIQKNGRCTEDYEIEVDLPQGQGGLHDLILTVGGQTTQRQIALDYKDPEVTTVSPDEVGTKGGDVIQISGNNLGCISSDALKLCSGGHKLIFVDEIHRLKSTMQIR